MKWDWYAASLEASPDHLLGELVSAWELADVEGDRPLHGYHEAAVVKRGDSTLARVMWGGNPGTHVVSTGQDAPVLQSALREKFPDHRVTRCDVAEDFKAPDAWDRLYALGLRVADRHNAKTSLMGDYHRAQDGRTLYLGTPKSVGQVRIYEKGIQTRTDPDWVRVEIAARPKRLDARERLASAEPAQVWGVTGWSKDLAERLGASDLERIRAGTVWDPTSDEQAWEWLCRQYGKLLGRKADALGGWCQLGHALEETISRQKNQKH
jgi:DNA relaxase NicK